MVAFITKITIYVYDGYLHTKASMVTAVTIDFLIIMVTFVNARNMLRKF
jgi:hypothetical protein